MAVALRLDVQQDVVATPGTAREFVTGIAVFDGQQWASLCREYDIASVGETAATALGNLQDAVREARAVAAERGLSAGHAVPEAELREFMLSHREGRGPATIARLAI